MSEDNAASVSKGVFVFKGTMKKANADDYFADGDSSVNLGRKEILDIQWKVTSEQIQRMQNVLNTKLFDDLVKYVETAHDGRKGNQQPMLEVPTAALITGINVSDHAGLFTSLVRCVRGRATRHVAVLHSKDCGTVHAAVTRTLAQLVGHDDKLEVIELEEEDEDKLNISKMSVTFDTLSSWYEYSCQSPTGPTRSPLKRPVSPLTVQASPTKRPKSLRRKLFSSKFENTDVSDSPVKRSVSPASSPSRELKSPRKSPRKSLRSPMPPPPRKKWPAIVIVLEDLEGFAPDVLQDFVTICSNHLSHLPLVLMFGIATAVTTVHRLLPSGVSSLMCIETFQSPPSSNFLTRVIERVVMTNDVPFKLGDKVFTLLLDLFLFHDFSVLNFIKGLQLAMMQHFYSSPASLLCQPLPQAMAAVRGMCKRQVDTVKQVVPSLASIIADMSDEERKLIDEEDNSDYIKDLVCDQLTSLDRYHRCFFPLLRCLHACTATLPKYPLGKQLRELYSVCLSGSVCEGTEYVEAMLLVRTFSRDELIACLEKCVAFMEDGCLPTGELKDTKRAIYEYIAMLENVEEIFKLAHPEESEEEEEQLDLMAPKEKKLRLHDLKQKLQALEKKKKKVTVYEAVRSDVIDLLEACFKHYLLCPLSFPLHEVYYYNNSAELRHLISASPRATMQRGLSDPHFYIKHPTLVCDINCISPSLPDISIVYKLHLECGRLINLYDWMQAFAMIVHSAARDGGVLTSDGRLNSVIQARFIHAVSELQFLGFIKPTNRKTDHVARLT